MHRICIGRKIINKSFFQNFLPENPINPDHPNYLVTLTQRHSLSVTTLLLGLDSTWCDAIALIGHYIFFLITELMLMAWNTLLNLCFLLGLYL